MSPYDLHTDEFTDYAWLMHQANQCIHAATEAHNDGIKAVWYGKATALRRMAFSMTLEQAERPAVSSHA